MSNREFEPRKEIKNSMIYVRKDNLRDATKEAFFRLLNGPSNTSDPAIWRESAAVIDIPATNAFTPSFTVQNDRFVYTDDYTQYFPNVDKALLATEEQDYTQLLI